MVAETHGGKYVLLQCRHQIYKNSFISKLRDTVNRSSTKTSVFMARDGGTCLNLCTKYAEAGPGYVKVQGQYGLQSESD